MRRITRIVLTLWLISGCRPAPVELTDDRKAEIAAEVDAAAAAWWDAWAAVDYDRGMSFVEDVPETASASTTTWSSTPRAPRCPW